MLLIKAPFIFLTIMRAITNFGKIQTFFTKYRPNKDPFSSKGLYYRPRSLNKDPGGSTAREYSSPSKNCGVQALQYGQPKVGFPKDFPTRIITKEIYARFYVIYHIFRLTHFHICSCSELNWLNVQVWHNGLHIMIIFWNSWNYAQQQKFLNWRILGNFSCNTLYLWYFQQN